MKIKNLLLGISIAAAVLIIFSAIAFILIGGWSDESYRPRYVELYVDVLKIIIVGLFVGLVSILIPHIFQEKRYDFEMCKEAKKVYSESLTGVMYLGSRLPYLKLAQDAFKHLEDLHSKKHLAETYYEYLELKNKEAVFKQREIWPANLDPGERIEEVKSRVVKIAGNWSEMTEKSRFDYLNNR